MIIIRDDNFENPSPSYLHRNQSILFLSALLYRYYKTIHFYLWIKSKKILRLCYKISGADFICFEALIYFVAINRLENSKVSMSILKDFGGIKHLVVTKFHKEIVIG